MMMYVLSVHHFIAFLSHDEAFSNFVFVLFSSRNRLSLISFTFLVSSQWRMKRKNSGSSRGNNITRNKINDERLKRKLKCESLPRLSFSRPQRVYFTIIFFRPSSSTFHVLQILFVLTFVAFFRTHITFYQFMKECLERCCKKWYI